MLEAFVGVLGRTAAAAGVVVVVSTAFDVVVVIFTIVVVVGAAVVVGAVVVVVGCAVSKDVSISSGGEFCNSLRGEIDSVDGLFAPLFILDFLVDRLLIYR